MTKIVLPRRRRHVLRRRQGRRRRRLLVLDDDDDERPTRRRGGVFAPPANAGVYFVSVDYDSINLQYGLTIVSNHVSNRVPQNRWTIGEVYDASVDV